MMNSAFYQDVEMDVNVEVIKKDCKMKSLKIIGSDYGIDGKGRGSFSKVFLRSDARTKLSLLLISVGMPKTVEQIESTNSIEGKKISVYEYTDETGEQQVGFSAQEVGVLKLCLFYF